MTALREAIRHDPDHVDAHNTLGGMLAEQGSPSEALEHFRVALRLEPDSPGIRRNIATLRERHPELFTDRSEASRL